MNSPRPRRLDIRALFALLGVALTDADFWAARSRKRKTRTAISQARDVYHQRHRPKVTAARLTAWHRAKNEAERKAKEAMVLERQLERERRRAA